MATAALTPAKAGILRSRPRAERFAWVVVAWNVVVVLWGAFVRASGSGDGCGNNWPLCNGQVIPVSPTLHTIIEFTHRQTAVVSTFLVLALLVWTFRATAKGSAARVLAVVSALLLVNEAILGAILVKFGYVTGDRSLGRVVVLAIHLSNTLLLLGSLTVTARLLGSGRLWRELRSTLLDRLLVSVGLIATLVVGVSGSLAALGDTLFPSASLRAAFAADISAHSPWLLRLRGIHPLSAFLAGAFVVWMIVQGRREGRIRFPLLLGGLLALQFALGILDVVLLAPAWMQIVHLLGADLYWIALISAAAAMLWDRDAGLSPRNDLRSRMRDLRHPAGV